MADDRKNSDFYKNLLLLVLTGLTATKWNALSDLTTWLVGRSVGQVHCRSFRLVCLISSSSHKSLVFFFVSFVIQYRLCRDSWRIAFKEPELQFRFFFCLTPVRVWKSWIFLCQILKMILKQSINFKSSLRFFFSLPFYISR